MNEKLFELFNYYKNLRSMQTIVQEIYTLDNLVVNFDEPSAIGALDFCVGKYGKEIRKIGSLYQNKVVVENDPDLYKKKDRNEVHSDVEFMRDCLIVIGAVKSGIRQSIQTVIAEINEY